MGRTCSSTMVQRGPRRPFRAAGASPACGARPVACSQMGTTTMTRKPNAWFPPTRHAWRRPPTSAPTVLGIYVECKVQADVARVDSLAGKRVVHAGVAQAKCESHVPRGGRVEATLGYPTPRAAEVRAAGNHAASGEVDPGFLVRTGQQVHIPAIGECNERLRPQVQREARHVDAAVARADGVVLPPDVPTQAKSQRITDPKRGHGRADGEIHAAPGTERAAVSI